MCWVSGFKTPKRPLKAKIVLFGEANMSCKPPKMCNGEERCFLDSDGHRDHQVVEQRYLVFGNLWIPQRCESADLQHSMFDPSPSNMQIHNLQKQKVDRGI